MKTALQGILRRLRWEFSRRFGDRTVDVSLIRDRLVAEPWFVDQLTVSGASVSIDGWSLAGATPSEFFINDRRFDAIGHPLPRPDVGKFFWQRKNAEMSGFHCHSANVDPLYRQGIMKIARSGDPDSIDSGRNAWYLPDVEAQENLPDEDRRFRVIGNRDLAGFLNTGATDFHRLDEVTRKLTGKPIWAFDNVLDWGVGCGRLARHFPAERASALSGCDIDHDNIEWCRVNLAGRFVRSSLEPPLPFDDATFDVIYGVSVFTHLREALQDRWLAELRRVTKVDGLVLTTVHGETAVEFFRLAPDAYANLKAEIAKQGLLVSSANTQLQGHVEQPSEYVNVFHDHGYIARRWSKYFDVLHIIPGYIFTHDLVVMRRRA
jgi:SAM-dependent methyltransferase